MNLLYETLKEHSKKQSLKLAAYIGNDKKRFKELIKLVVSKDTLVSQRAAWTMTWCAKNNPEIILPHLNKLIENLNNDNLHDAVKRNTIRVMQDVKIPKLLQGKAADICFRYISSATEATAIRAFAMTVLGNLCKEEPDLKNELRLLITTQMQTGKAALVSRGNKTLKIIDDL